MFVSHFVLKYIHLNVEKHFISTMYEPNTEIVYCVELLGEILQHSVHLLIEKYY